VRRRLQVFVSIALAAGLLAFFLSRVDLAAIGRRIAQASPGWLLASLLIALLSFAMRALRWTWMLRPVARVPFFSAFFATAVGFAANTVLPARAGEIVRPALLARERRLPFSPLLASILFERILDAACVLFFLLLAIAEGPPPGASGAFAMLGRAAVIPAVLLAAVIAAALLAVFRRSAAERFLARLTRRLPARIAPRAQAFAATFLDGFQSLRQPGLSILIVAGSLFMWLIINVQVYAVLRAFGLAYPFSASYVTTAAAVLGLAVPTPGGIGGYHAAVQVALTSIYGAPVVEASGVALLAHAISFVPITLIGFLFLALSPAKLRLSEVAQAPETSSRG
jgi:glycosyltransferase 2 family protein